MKILKSNSDQEKELPLQLNISFKKVFELFEKYAGKEFSDHPFHGSASEMVALFKKSLS
ncbi:hypothetical protein [Polaribacter ponticola]|uniref:Uncharacterized protein n=1 Tax=Polaribacter ponticola TaxID=2978475 RepID=A0ABT5SCM4_9FLAO|nr:hypothetical protein [Polaribacter sp. MSW5]MDD7915882.1 hypothetical protein [Polaribacter sp. MSW5]